MTYIKFRIESDEKAEFKAICDEFDLNMSDILKMSVDKVNYLYKTQELHSLKIEDLELEMADFGEELCKKYEGFPQSDSPNGLYMNGCTEITDIQYAIFSSKDVAKKSLTMIENCEIPIIFGVFSRIKKQGVADLLDFFEQFVQVLKEEGVKGTNLELGSLDLSRLGRRYSSFSALFSMFEMASDEEIGIKFMGSSDPVAVFGLCTGAIGQTSMRFNQTIKRLKSRYRKSKNPELDITFEDDQYALSAVSDLLNNKTAYQPHLSVREYYEKISSELGSEDWKVHI